MKKLCLIKFSACFFSCIISLLSVEGLAQIAEPFPSGANLSKAVWFWEEIFTNHGSHDHLIHDAWYPDLIIDVVKEPDIKHSAKANETPDFYLKKYRLALESFRKKGLSATKFGALERRLYKVYSAHPQGLNHLLSGRASLRTQQGLADIFRDASGRAQQYLPYMEKIFKEAKAPSDLTRIVFVESMFRLNARSKVGAVGIWQFMPETAKLYLTVNQSIDERHSPFKASQAAARMLLAAFQELGSWPLAITSYNHGLNGMKRAVKSLKTLEMEEIIRDYKSPSFGFASRNFYAEFLAARNIYKKHFESPQGQNQNPLAIAAVSLNQALSLADLLKLPFLNETLLRQHNPCLRPNAFHPSHRLKQLPLSYQFYIPLHLASQVEKSLKQKRLTMQKQGASRPSAT